MTLPARPTALSLAWAAAKARAAPPLALVPNAAESFVDYVKRVRPRFLWHRVALELASVLQRVADGELKRVMIFEPPRHGKSELVSRLFPAYILSRYPEQWVGLASYSAGLARTLSRAARSNFLQGGGKLAGDSKAVDHWETAERGGMWSAGRGGSITGKGHHWGFIDDPLKGMAEANSETIRFALREWYDTEFYTRAEPDGAIVLTQTRWHEADLAGGLIADEEVGEEPEHWYIVHLPAIAEDEIPAYPPTCTVHPDWRAPGEALCPPRYDLAALRRIRARNARMWASLYQQRPAPPSGNIFKRDHIRFWCPAGRLPEFLPPFPGAIVVELPPVWLKVIQSWDFTFKGEKGKTELQGTDFVVGQVWGALDVRRFLLEEVRGQFDFIETLAAIRTLTKAFPAATAKYYEDKANGPAIKSALQKEVPGMIAVEPDGDKIARAYSEQASFEAGEVYFPHPNVKAWVGPAIIEWMLFPAAKRKDRVDTGTQALKKLRTLGGDSGWDTPDAPDPVGTAAIVARSQW